MTTIRSMTSRGLRAMRATSRRADMRRLRRPLAATVAIRTSASAGVTCAATSDTSTAAVATAGPLHA
eukprot:1927383-Prymnesium_polylepis.3